MSTSPFDARPIIVAIAGPNGAGKSTFFQTHLADSGLQFINADDLARGLGIGPYDAADIARRLREALVAQGESFVFETVLSDPTGDKVEFLRRTAEQGYTVVMVFIGVSGPEVSDERVAMRVARGEHDVPREKLLTRYPRTMTNLQRAISALPHVLVFDNSDLRRPFRKVAEFRDGVRMSPRIRLPAWLKTLLPRRGKG